MWRRAKVEPADLADGGEEGRTHGEEREARHGQWSSISGGKELVKSLVRRGLLSQRISWWCNMALAVLDLFLNKLFFKDVKCK